MSVENLKNNNKYSSKQWLFYILKSISLFLTFLLDFVNNTDCWKLQAEAAEGV